MIANGMGRHTSEVAYENYVVVRKLLIVAEVFYTWILCGTKISVLLMYSRIFGLADHFVRAPSTWLNCVFDSLHEAILISRLSRSAFFHFPSLTALANPS